MVTDRCKTIDFPQRRQWSNPGKRQSTCMPHKQSVLLIKGYIIKVFMYSNIYNSLYNKNYVYDLQLCILYMLQ